MNRINTKLKTAILFFCLFSSYILFPQEHTEDMTGTEKKLDKRDRPFVIFNEGLSAASVTRIIKKETVSNFVWNDILTGLFFSMETKQMQPINSVYRIALYYPYSFTFRKVPQVPKNVIRYATDGFAGILFEPTMWNFFNFNISPGIHFLFQNSDSWNYIHLGIGSMAGVEFPISRHWTLMVNGFLSLDYGNLGTNAKMQPYDIVYQYQLDMGVRYSKKSPNNRPYIKSRN
ncbi:hypothetical protein V1L52_07000 [Treponema sp. HNW]|uniref:hypothetical protein n=1 Tax=Treponema sp. HNW TaxID=3116654 RepID=UPI003D1160F6